MDMQELQDRVRQEHDGCKSRIERLGHNGICTSLCLGCIFYSKKLIQQTELTEADARLSPFAQEYIKCGSPLGKLSKKDRALCSKHLSVSALASWQFTAAGLNKGSELGTCLMSHAPVSIPAAIGFTSDVMKHTAHQLANLLFPVDTEVSDGATKMATMVFDLLAAVGFYGVPSSIYFSHFMELVPTKVYLRLFYDTGANPMLACKTGAVRRLDMTCFLSTELLKPLLEDGLDPNMIFLDEFSSPVTPLQYACRKGAYDIAKLLLLNGAAPHFVIPEDVCIHDIYTGGPLPLKQQMDM